MARRKRVGAGSKGVYRDHNWRTCLLLKDGDEVEFIPLDISEGFQVHTTTRLSFDKRYQPMVDYPLDKAAALYLNYSLAVGASEEVIDHLATIIDVSAADRETAISKRAPTKVEKPKRQRKVKDAPKSPDSTTTRKARRAVRKAKNKSGYSSAAQMFQALIMAGELTDDEIFAQVQEAFGLEDKKRSYVKWYRNNLTKQGKNPPEAK